MTHSHGDDTKSIRIPADVHDSVSKTAAAEGRSKASMLTRAWWTLLWGRKHLKMLGNFEQQTNPDKEESNESTTTKKSRKK